MNETQTVVMPGTDLAHAIPAGAYLPAPTQIQLEQIINLVVKGLTSPHTKRVYRMALTKFLTFYQESGFTAFTKASANSYKDHLLSRTIYDKDGNERHLAPATINIQLSAIRALAIEAADEELISQEAASAIRRVKSVKPSGTSRGNWLTAEQADALLAQPSSSTLMGIRDRAVLALLLASGVRRQELINLQPDDIRQVSGRWVIADLIGKGHRVRTVPIPAWAKVALDSWAASAGITSGHLFRPINRGGRVWGEKLSAQSVWKIVNDHAAALGFPELAPHDLRRTYARLSYESGAPLGQLQLSLGHASIQTTERYVGIRQNFSKAPCDYLTIGQKINSHLAQRSQSTSRLWSTGNKVSKFRASERPVGRDRNSEHR